MSKKTTTPKAQAPAAEPAAAPAPQALPVAEPAPPPAPAAEPTPPVPQPEPGPALRTYRVVGRILFDGRTLRPAKPATGRQADTVQLTDQLAHGLAGFVELLATEDATPKE